MFAIGSSGLALVFLVVMVATRTTEQARAPEKRK
jgi:hypothetical protein